MDETMSEAVVILFVIVLTFIVTIGWLKRKGKRKNNRK